MTTFDFNALTGKLDLVQSLTALDSRYILRAPTVRDEAWGNVPADFGWSLGNVNDPTASNLVLYNTESGTALLLDLETYGNYDPGVSGGFRGAGIVVNAPVAAAASVKTTGALLRFTGKSGTNFLGVYPEHTFMHGPAGTLPRTCWNFGGGFGEGAAGIGISRNAYFPGQFAYQSAHSDITAYFGGGTAATNAAAQMHVCADYVDKSGRPRLARRSVAAITATCGASWGDSNILIVSNTVGMADHIGKPVWPFNMDYGNVEYDYGQTNIAGIDYGDSPEWTCPYELYKVQEKSSRLNSATNVTGTAGNYFVTTTASIAGFVVGDLVRIRQGGAVREYREITGLTAGAPNRIDFDPNSIQGILNNYTGAASQVIECINTLGAIKLQTSSSTKATGSVPYLTRDYGPSDLNARGNDFVIVGELYSDTSGWLKHFGNPCGRGQIPPGVAFVQVADSDINDIRDNIQVTAAASPALVGGGHYVPLATINVPAGTFTVNVVAAPVAPWDFQYSVMKYEMDR